MSILKKICRLCLQKCENFKAVDENTKMLLPKIDFTAIQEPIMCKDCAEMVMKCFDFKLKCLRTRDYIIPFINNDSIELDLKDVYLSKNETSTDIPEDEGVCGLCMNLVKNCAAVSLDVEEKDDMLWKMIEQYLPELDLSIVKKAVICPSCRGSLEDGFRFVTNCLLVEQEIKKYREALCSSNKDQNGLNSLPQLVDGNSVDIIKVEKDFYEDRERSNEDVQNKNESFLGFDDQKVYDKQQFTPNMYACEEENNKCGSIKKEEISCEENLAEIKEQKYLVNEDIEIKTDTDDFDRFQESSTITKVEEDISVLKSKGGYTKFIDQPELSYKNSDGEMVYKCEACPYEVKRRYELKRHKLTHTRTSEITIFKCDVCPYKNKCKDYFNRHKLMHKNTSELTVFECDQCSYVGRYRNSIKRHKLIHKSASELRMFKCELCSYQAKRSETLKRHKLTHKSTSELTMFKCDLCSYEGKHIDYLRRHKLIHEGS